MPPLRRYLRITATTVLETRIYTDNPLDIPRWLLSAHEPALPRVLQAVRGLVLPKLREENENGAKGKGGGKGKRKGWKDVVVRDEFEVSIFLTETSARHTILRKEKRVRGWKARVGGVGGGGKMTGGGRDAPVEVAEEEGGVPGLLREEEEGGGMLDDAGGGTAALGEKSSLGDDEEGGEDGDDKKKKMGLETTYEGFSIYGRILCLVVKRKGVVRGKEVVAGTGQAMMEEWIASTQGLGGEMMDE